ncbi:MAG: TIGR00153 family protein [Euryarchaeota archaeon]|nr:TIGR00153 family protein [Euryarchaeota archaeon]
MTPEDPRDAKHFRAPIADTLRKRSPFDNLFEHAAKVRECLAVLNEGFEKYVQGDFESFHKYRDDVSRIEHEADMIKYNARAHFPRSIFMPVARTDFLSALSQQDKILDYAEALADLMDMRPTKIPESLKEKILDHKRQVLECAEFYEKTVDNLREAIEASFSKKEREETKALIKQVHKAEWQADQLGNIAKRAVYKLEMEGDLSPMDEYHILKIIDWVDEIADRAENAAERVRAMIAK